MYKIRTLICIGCILITSIRINKAQDYSSLALKPELTSNANAIFRLMEMKYQIIDTSKSVLSCHFIITVLNKNGDEMGEFEEYYDKFSKIQDLKGKLYNKLGMEIKKFKSSDFADLSAVSNFSIYDDNRVKYGKPVVSAYPYTVEYEFTIVYDGYINILPWHPQSYYDLSIEKATYDIITPKGLNLRFKPLSPNITPSITETSGNKVYHMECKDIPAVENEIMTAGIQDVTQVGYFIPEYFKIGGKTCRNDNWKDLGMFFSKINNQPNQLSEKTILELNVLKVKSKSKKELVKLVYEYMQSKTRYVSIQMGIGGLQPFDASVVDKFGYGDCKALTNYTKTLLQNVGIQSFYTLVNAGSNAANIITDESFQQFNHAILCVPMERDTTWLECTSQTIPFGFLGDFTDNRNVLLITDNGGILTKTRYYNQYDNQQKDRYEVQLKPDGEAVAKINIQYTGLQYDDHNRLLYLNPVEQKESLYNQFRIPAFDINNYNLKEIRDEIPSLELDIDLTVRKYAVTVGNRLLLSLNMLNKRQAVMDNKKERKSKMRIRYSYFDSDTVSYHLPEGYAVESLPKPMELKSVFGSYKAQVISDEKFKTIQYIREFKVNDGIYPPEQYKDYVAFIKSVSTFDNVKVSLIQKI